MKNRRKESRRVYKVILDRMGSQVKTSMTGQLKETQMFISKIKEIMASHHKMTTLKK